MINNDSVEVPIETVVYNEKYYPRIDFNREKVTAYRANIEELPPIIVQKEQTILIDGYHRLIAHRLENKSSISVIYEEISEDQILWRSAELNAKHGLQLSMKEKELLSQKFIINGHSTKELAALLAVHQNTILDWTEDERKEQKDEENNLIWKSYLRCLSDSLIAELIGKHRTTISRRIESLVQNHINGKMHNPPNSLQFYNDWRFGKRDDQYGLENHPGQIAGQIIENLLWYYTKPLDLVVDPMAGGGTTLDVCLSMNRKCLAYDLEPKRNDIKQNDVIDGLPQEAQKCDLVFLDPPYYTMVEEFRRFFTNEQDFFDFMKRIAEVSVSTIKPKGLVALLIGDIVKVNGTRTWISHKCIPFFEAAGLEGIDFKTVPHSSQQYAGYDVARAKEAKEDLPISRSLFIFQKQEDDT